MPLTASTLIPLITFILYGVLYFVAIFSKSNTQVQERNAFRFYLLLMLLWSLSAFFVFVDLSHTTFWFRIMVFSAFGSAVVLIRFVNVVLRRKWTWINWVYLYGITGMFLSLATDLVIKDASFHSGVLEYNFGILITVIAAPGYLLNIFSLYQLILGFRYTEDLRQRNRLRYLILGVSIILAINLINFTPLGKYPID